MVCLLKIITLDIAHTVRPSRQEEIGANHYLTSMLNEPSLSKRKELFGKSQEERERFKSMVEYRIKTGCSYRFEFTFVTSTSDLESVFQRDTLNLVQRLENYVKTVISPQLQLIPCSIFPKCLWVVYDYFWNISIDGIKLFLQEGYVTTMDYSKREFIALMDRLMVVCINGNIQRNLSNWTGRELRIVQNIREKNWPFLSLTHFDSSLKSINLWVEDSEGKKTITSNGDLFLFRYFAGSEKTLVKSNLLSLLALETQFLNFENGYLSEEQLKTEYLSIFKAITENFICEIVTLIKEKLERHSVNQKSTQAFRQIFSSISKVNNLNFLKALANGRECGTELYTSNAGMISLSDLWDRHVVKGEYTSVQGLPDWFRSWATLVSYHTILGRHSSRLDNQSRNEIIESSKVIFNNCFQDQKIMIKFDRNVFWRNIGTFYFVEVEHPFTQLNSSVNELGINVTESGFSSATTIPRVSRRLPQQRQANNQLFVKNLVPSRFERWRMVFVEDTPLIQETLMKYLSFSLQTTQFSNLSVQSDAHIKWIVLSSFVLAELQVLVGNGSSISNRSRGMKDKRKYRVALFCLFICLYLEIPIPRHTAAIWKRYYENNTINLRYFGNY